MTIIFQIQNSIYITNPNFLYVITNSNLKLELQTDI